MIIFQSPPCRKKIAVTVVIIIEQEGILAYYELSWLKCKEGWLSVSNISELSFLQEEML